MSTQYPPLPHRRLKMMANGVWDEAKKAFYPFIVYSSSLNNASIPGKANIMYFIKDASISGENNGDKAPASNYVQITQNGETRIVCFVKISQTVAASYVNSSEALFCEVDVLTDSGTPILIKIGSSTGFATVVYAEIPSDLGWVAVE